MIEIWIDGACEPTNPGIGTYGWVAKEDNQIFDCENGLVSKIETTNNIAEYTALIKALEWAVSQNIFDVVIYSDSKLVVNQVNGLWKVKAEHLQPFRDKAFALAEQVRATLEWISRDDNTLADALSKNVNEILAEG